MDIIFFLSFSAFTPFIIEAVIFFTIFPLVIKVDVVGSVKNFLTPAFKPLAELLKSIGLSTIGIYSTFFFLAAALAFLITSARSFFIDSVTADLNKEGDINFLSNIRFNTSNVEFTPEALLTSLESVPFVKTR